MSGSAKVMSTGVHNIAFLHTPDVNYHFDLVMRLLFAQRRIAPSIGLTVTFGPPERATTPPRNLEDSSPVQFVAWSPAKDPLDAEAQAAEEAEARERLWKFHQSRALHLRAAILATQYMFLQDPPQGPED
ncbi:hypothetical protein EDB87DRAFT_1687286 [Lactarius vividus]|nr:hypothetical protein EDB87DRAFT_1687286 [Lactarius vividus]